ncbi:invasion associated locus B family protein [Paracoccus sp. R12_1]|nr:invasion associated locus B family protein [Paracoccus sp. R12_2]MBO9484904.1 invasion associated locus B family protein [Paracoccus sp. R12_1]
MLAALAVIAAPAFAQDSATPAEPDSAAQSSTAEAPATEAPAAEAPATEAPAAETSSGEDATADAPAADAPDADEQPAAAAPATSAAGAATATDEAASGEPKVGSYYAKSSHTDWTVRCIKAEQGKDPCELYQLMQDADGNSVAELTLIPLTNGDVAAGATLVAPLETDLIQGLGFAVDNGKPRGYPFSFCAPVGCVSRIGLSAEELGQMKRGSAATVTLMPFGGDPKQPVELGLSLAGFTAAFDELSAYAAKDAAAAE